MSSRCCRGSSVTSAGRASSGCGSSRAGVPMDSSPGLSPLQAELLREFFARESRFVLTGGGALAGFHLRHRTSDDLDLFTKPPVDLEEGRRALVGAASALGCSVEVLKTSPDFHRVLVRRGQDSVIVDL